MKKIYGICGLLTVLTACSSGPDLDKMSVDELYNYAFDELEATRYKKAAEAFEKVETDFPYSKWAVKSKLMGAYAYYKNEQYDDAVIAADRFIQYHPGNKDAAYAYYLKGMCYYDQISSADKDQGDTQRAEETFSRLIALYPDSAYAKDVANKVNLAEDYKAGQEMIIGRFYLKAGNYLSALNRFNVVLEEYQTTIQIEEALYREVEIYAIFGMNRYANGYYKILKQNYPDGKWTAKAAKVIAKIGEEDVEPKKVSTAEPVEQAEPTKSWYQRWKDKKADTKEVADEPSEEESKSWFSGWFGGSDEEKTVEVVEEKLAPVDEPSQEESKSWFSGWFGGSDEEETVEAPKVAENTAEEESKSWFSGWFGSSDDEKQEVKAKAVEAPAEESKSWFSGWFGGSDEEKQEVVQEPVETKIVLQEPEPEVDQSGSEVKSWLTSWFDKHSDAQ